MPTLLEKPSQASSPALPTRLLHSRHHWERWRGILLTAFIGLTSTIIALWALHLSRPASENGKIIFIVWLGGLLLTLLIALILWWLAPASLSVTAQNMDQDLDTKNRFEAAATLDNSTSLIAQAQREETAAYLRGTTPHVGPVRVLPWLVGGVILVAVAHLLTLWQWGIPALAPAAPKLPPSPKLVPQASIVWKSPEPESKANPIEEVPTVAVAQSTTGLKNLTLEISVNGTSKKSIPLPAKPYDTAGKNTLKTSLYLDELDAQPYDIISYFIRGARIADQKLPDTTSPIQFIEVRPFRDDVNLMPGGGVPHTVYALLIRLKLAQLYAVKANFILAHTDIPATDPVRMKENERIGKNQGELSAKTEEIIQAFIQQSAPPQVIDLLRQAEPPMDDAAKKILATQNSEALPPQQKALSLIIEVEKFFIKEMSKKSAVSKNSNPEDPFKDKQKHELKPRGDVTAGRLEQLAKTQSKLAQDINSKQPSDSASPSAADKPAPDANSHAPSDDPMAPQAIDPFGPNADKGTVAERQARVLQGIGTLLNGNDALPPTVQPPLQEAQKHATQSVHQLDLSDKEGAREPAFTAAQDLQRAVAEMNKVGEEQTRTAMEAAQAKLNDLAQQLRELAQDTPSDAPQKLADIAAQLNDLQGQLHDAANQQQESGSAAAAQRLEQLAKAIADEKVGDDLADMSKNGLDANKASGDAQKLEKLAGQAAQSSLAGSPTAQAISKMINSLEKSRANLSRLAQKGHSAGTGQGQTPPNTPPGQEHSGNNPDGHNTENEPANAHGAGVGVGKAFKETLSDLKNEVQRVITVVPHTDTADIMKTLDAVQSQNTQYRETTMVNAASAYQMIAPPLDQLITELKEIGNNAQRNTLIKQPNLDEAPPAYRSAVSDYFETMSRDYKPAGDDPAPNPPVKKP